MTMSPSRDTSVGVSSSKFDIVEAYRQQLRDDPELTMPVAAIEALIDLLAQSQTATVFETLKLLEDQSAYLKSKIPNSVSLSAGTDLFQRFMIKQLKSSTNIDDVRQHLLSNGRLFAKRAKDARDKIAAYGSHFIQDGTVVLTHGGSRVVGQLLEKAADASQSRGSIGFKVIYVLNDARASESKAIVKLLRSKGVPVATICEGAVGYAMEKVDLVFVGAEGVVENGGIISRLGTYQIALLAKAAGKPFYVAAETHKFVRLYPLGQYDLGIDQNVINFSTENESEPAQKKGDEHKTPTVDYFEAPSPIVSEAVADAVDFTPPANISALISETGVLTPSAVSEELISLWF